MVRKRFPQARLTRQREPGSLPPFSLQPAGGRRRAPASDAPAADVRASFFATLLD